MKLLQINVVVNSGSTGRIVEEIGQRALAEGWESHILYGRDRHPSQSQAILMGTGWDMRWHAMQARLFDRQGLGSKQRTRRLVKQIQRIRPDVIHLHVIHGYYLNYPILFAYLSAANIPVVWTQHDCWSFTGHCVYFSLAHCDKWKTGCYGCTQLHQYPASWGWDRSRPNYRDKKHWFTSVRNMMLVSVSDWLAGMVKQSFLGKIPACRIYNGIDTELFRPLHRKEVVYKRYCLTGDFLVLGVANTWDERKGLADFLRLRDLLPMSVQFLLVGLSEKQLKQLPKGIIGLSRTENLEQLAELYSAADVLFNSSQEETFGMTTVEALSCGTPVIVYNTTASPELVDAKTGFVVEAKELDVVAHAIEIIKQQEKSHYSEACRKRAVEKFRKELCYTQYIELYKQLIENI